MAKKKKKAKKAARASEQTMLGGQPDDRGEFFGREPLEEVEIEEENSEEIFRSHARKLGIPDDGTVFDSEELRAQWTGTGVTCAEILSTIEKKVLANDFLRIEIPDLEETTKDPVAQELEKFKLAPKKCRESIFRKSKGGWIATVMMEHNLEDSSEEDTAAVFFFIEEE